MYSRSTNTKPKKWQAPSWSWAPIDGTILMMGHTNEPYHAEVVDYQLELADPENPFGEVTGGTLRIRGPLLKVRWKKTGGRGLPKVYKSYGGGLGGHDVALGDLFLDDFRDEPKSLTELGLPVCLLIGDRTRQHDLALRPLHDNGQDMYTRMGLVRYDNKSLTEPWRDASVETITII